MLVLALPGSGKDGKGYPDVAHTCMANVYL